MSRLLHAAAALAGAALVAACTGNSGFSATGSHSTTEPAAAANAKGCRSPAGIQAAPNGPIVLGVISIGDAPWPAVPVHQGQWRYWQKDGLKILDGHQTVTITLPRPWRNRAAITWGVNSGIVSTLRLPGTLLTPGCPAGPLQWNNYAGGFYLRSSSACVPLVFRVGDRSAVVRVGVGRRCGPVP
jgi:hypothetical protein